MQDRLQITLTNMSYSQEMMHVWHQAILSVVLSHWYLLTPYSHVRAVLQGNSTDFTQQHLFAGAGAKKVWQNLLSFPQVSSGWSGGLQKRGDRLRAVKCERS